MGRVMVAPKTAGGTYGLSVLGLVLGILGLHRFYLRRYVSAIIMSLPLIAGLLILVGELVIRYYGLLDQLTASLSAIDGGNIDLSVLSGDLAADAKISGDKLLIAYFGCGISLAWWLLDLFLIPSMVKHFNKEHASS